MKKTLVIGASAKSERYSHKAVKRLNKNNHPVIALGNRTGFIDNTEIKTEMGTEDDIHTITMYIGPKRQPDYFDLIKSIKPKRIILNPGTENNELVKLAQENNIEVVHGCTLVMLSTNQY